MLWVTTQSQPEHVWRLTNSCVNQELLLNGLDYLTSRCDSVHFHIICDRNKMSHFFGKYLDTTRTVQHNRLAGNLNHIYIYAFSRRFYPKWLTHRNIQAIIIVFFFISMCVPLGIEPTTFCAGNAMLYHWATGTLRIDLSAAVTSHFQQYITLISEGSGHTGEMMLKHQLWSQK